MCLFARLPDARGLTCNLPASSSITISPGTRWTWSNVSDVFAATGQAHTAQVYNLVSTDTIEGQIYLLLEQKLLEIAKALGKVDEFGQVAEDLRGQILGQLSERLSYDRLYQNAVRDPRPARTRQELEVAIDNARAAREIVLFQDLEVFRLDDYKQMDDGGRALRALCAIFNLPWRGMARSSPKFRILNSRYGTPTHRHFA